MMGKYYKFQCFKLFLCIYLRNFFFSNWHRRLSSFWRLLSADELKPIIDNLHPSEHFYAKQQADYVISQADTNKDGLLSMKEMIDNPYVFYNALFTENDYEFHDELR